MSGVRGWDEVKKFEESLSHHPQQIFRLLWPLFTSAKAFFYLSQIVQAIGWNYRGGGVKTKF